MRKVLLLLSGVLFIYIASFAQVNMQTGAAEQSFPLINYTDSKAGLSLGVGIGYSSGNGLLVNEIATNVGIGWSLEAGGAIVRMQNGQPDDQDDYSSGGNYYYPGYLYNPNVGKGCNIGLNVYPLYKKKENNVYKDFKEVKSDVEQDKFVFNFGGRSGTFIIGKDWKVNTIGDSRIKIEIVVGTREEMTVKKIRTRIKQFTITTEDGVKYVFKDLGLSEVRQYKYAEFKEGKWQVKNGNPESGDRVVNRFYGFEINDSRPFIVNSWFLSEIENTNNGQKISFNYQDVNTKIIASKTVSHNRDLNKSPLIKPVPFFDVENINGDNWYNALVNNPAQAEGIAKDLTKLNKLAPSSTMLIYNVSISKTKRISSISLPNNGTITFAYDAIGRVDLEGENALAGINYYIDSKFIRGYKLQYGYLYKNTIKDYYQYFNTYEKKFTRLCLLSLQKVGNNFDNATEPPYKFDYIVRTNLTSLSKDDIIPAQNFLSQDHWGYYNGSTSQLNPNEDHDFLSDERNSYFKTVLYPLKQLKNLYAQNGLLRSVHYPTGGKLYYRYRQNKRYDRAVNMEVDAGGVSVDETRMTDGENSAKDIYKTYSYKLADGKSSRWGYEEPVNYSLSGNIYFLKKFKKRFSVPGIEYPEMATSINMGAIFGKALLSGLISGGIQFGVGVLLGQIGLGAVVPVLNAIITAYAIIKFLVNLLSNVERRMYTYTLSNQNYIGNNPIGERYSRVEVQTNSPTGYNGKTIYEFTSDKDYPVIRRTLTWPYTQAPRAVSWAYGLPKSVVAYNKDNQVVNETYNSYNLHRVTFNYLGAIAVPSISQNPALAYNITTNNKNCKCETQIKHSIRSTQRNDYNSFAAGQYMEMLPRPYNYITGRVDQLGTLQKSYNTKGDLYYEDRTSVLTDPLTLLQKAKTVQKDPNSTMTTISYFPTDYNISGAIATLKSNNALHTPISTETWETKYKVEYNDNGPYTVSEKFLLDAKVTEFDLFTFNGIQQVRPKKIYTLRTNAPIPASVIGEVNIKTPRSSIFLFNGIDKDKYYKLETEMVYDNSGNLVQTISNENVTSFINDYSDRYVVASVANANYADIAYTSFEGNGKGQWSFDQSKIITTSQLTGNKAYQLSTSGMGVVTRNIRTGEGAPQKYTITYWAKNGSGIVLLNGQSGVEQYTTPYGWTLYKAELNSITTLAITGTGIIDELRLYPTGSLMSTVSYQEGIGKISDCDANNRLMFYEYDALGRLKIIRDQNRNIIKTYEYNYKH